VRFQTWVPYLCPARAAVLSRLRKQPTKRDETNEPFEHDSSGAKGTVALRSTGRPIRDGKREY
jgi:hypothetical protein